MERTERHTDRWANRQTERKKKNRQRGKSKKERKNRQTERGRKEGGGRREEGGGRREEGRGRREGGGRRERGREGDTGTGTGIESKPKDHPWFTPKEQSKCCSLGTFWRIFCHFLDNILNNKSCFFILSFIYSGQWEEDTFCFPTDFVLGNWLVT